MSNGIQFESVEGELPPKPPIDESQAEGLPGGEAPKLPTKIPLHPAMVRLPLRAEGAILAELTKWPGWEHAEQDLNDLAELGQSLNIELNPTWQFLLAIVSVHAVKAMGFVAWLRAGRPMIKKEEKHESTPEQSGQGTL